MADKTYRNSKDKYLKEKVDTFVLRVPKGIKDEISSHAKGLGLSLNAYVTELIFKDMGMDFALTKKAANTKKTEQQQETAQNDELQTAAHGDEPPKKKMPSFLL